MTEVESSRWRPLAYVLAILGFGLLIWSLGFTSRSDALGTGARYVGFVWTGIAEYLIASWRKPFKIPVLAASACAFDYLHLDLACRLTSLFLALFLLLSAVLRLGYWLHGWQATLTKDKAKP